MTDMSIVAALCLIAIMKAYFFTAASFLISQHVYIGDLKGSEDDAFIDFCVVVIDMLTLWLLHILQESVEQESVEQKGVEQEIL